MFHQTLLPSFSYKPVVTVTMIGKVLTLKMNALFSFLNVFKMVSSMLFWSRAINVGGFITLGFILSRILENVLFKKMTP